MSKPIFVLEGCDGAGKTTMAKQLSKVFDIPIIHSTAETKNDYMYHLELLQKHKETGAVFDRFCYGDFVYAPLFNREPKMSKAELDRLEKVMINMNVMVIYVTANVPELQMRLKVRGDETDELVGMVPEIKNHYSIVFSDTMIIPYFINTSTGEDLWKMSVVNEEDYKSIVTGDKIKASAITADKTIGQALFNAWDGTSFGKKQQAEVLYPSTKGVSNR